MYTEDDEWSRDTWLDSNSPDPPYDDDSDDLREGNNVKVVAPVIKIEQTLDVLPWTTVRGFVSLELTDLQHQFSAKVGNTPPRIDDLCMGKRSKPHPHHG